MKIKTTIISLIISVAFILSLALITIDRQDKQIMNLDIPVKISDGTIVDEYRDVLYFEPAGNNVNLDFEVQGSDRVVSSIQIMTDDPSNDPIYETTAGNINFSTGELDAGNKKLFVVFEPEIRSGADVESDSEESILYTVVLHEDLSSGHVNGIIFVEAAALIILSVFLVVSINRSYAKEFDERMVRVRGEAALNAMMVMAVCSSGLAFISFATEKFPLSVFESGIITIMLGVTTFALIADMNDAYLGMKIKRLPYAIACMIVGLCGLIASGLFSLIFGHGPVNGLSTAQFIIGLCFMVQGIEMLIKSIRDRKEAAADEES